MQTPRKIEVLNQYLTETYGFKEETPLIPSIWKIASEANVFGTIYDKKYLVLTEEEKLVVSVMNNLSSVDAEFICRETYFYDNICNSEILKDFSYGIKTKQMGDYEVFKNYCEVIIRHTSGMEHFVNAVTKKYGTFKVVHPIYTVEHKVNTEYGCVYIYSED